MEELGIPELDSKQIEKLCTIAEETARKYILSKISPKRIESLNISAEVEGSKPVNLTVDIDVSLLPLMEKFNVQELVNDAVKEALSAAKKYLEELKCRSKG